MLVHIQTLAFFYNEQTNQRGGDKYSVEDVPVQVFR